MVLHMIGDSNRRFPIPAVTAAACLALVGVGLEADAASSPVRNPDGRPLSSFVAEGTRFMVASASDEATRAAVEVLTRGGNAVDAAVAASFALAVTRPQSTGIGGGGFLLLYRADSRAVEIFDFRETAPASASRDMYLGQDGQVIPEASVLGHRAVAVPGLVAGLAAVHQDHGTEPWAGLLAPAIRLAESGFEAYPELVGRLSGRREIIARNPAMAEIFLPGDRAWAAGERLVQRDLAATLEAIARGRRDGFYRGWVAETMVEDMAAHGGLITLADLDQYRVEKRDPVRGTYRGYTLVSMPPPSSGGVHILQMLHLMEGYDLKALGRGTPATVHRMAEAMRQAYADRAELLGDPAFTDVPVERLLSLEYADECRARIPKERARSSHAVRPLVASPRESNSTTHLSIVDADGNIVSSTQTINYSFGACVVAAGTGVILNNEMDDFSASPGVPNAYGLLGGQANAIAPGKRPLSSMSPTLVFSGDRPWLVVGSPGGSRIITTVLQTLVNRIDFGLPLAEAVSAGRMHHQWFPDRIELEADVWPASLGESLTSWGHGIHQSAAPMGEVQAVEIHPDGSLVGVSDPRRSGRPEGK